MSLTAANTDDLTRHGGAAWFKKSGDDNFVHLGFIETFKINMAADTKFNYKSRLSGTKVTAKTFIDERATSINFSTMSVTAFNLGLVFGGEPSVNTDGTKTIRIKTLSTIRGTLQFRANVDDGNPISGEWTVDLSPTGEVDLLPDQLVELSMVADVVAEVETDNAMGEITVDDGGTSL